MFKPFKSSRLIRAASLAMGGVIIGGVAVIATASAAAMIGFRPTTSAQADESTVAAAELRVSSQACSDFMSHFAVEIGKTQAEINAAFQRAIADTLADEVKAGRLTQSQADAIKARLASKTPCALGGAQPRGAKLEAFMQQYVAAAAAALGITEAQLKTDLRSGQSLSQIAAAKKVSESDFRTRLIANLKPVLDKAVTNKRITSAQENTILDRLKTGPLPLWNRARNPKPAPAATPSAG
jgi:hypothetical protein